MSFKKYLKRPGPHGWFLITLSIFVQFLNFVFFFFFFLQGGFEYLEMIQELIPIFVLKLESLEKCLEYWSYVTSSDVVHFIETFFFLLVFIFQLMECVRSVHREKKFSHFDLKSESVMELEFDRAKWVTGEYLSQFDSQSWANLTLNVEPIRLSMLRQFDSQCWVN